MFAFIFILFVGFVDNGYTQENSIVGKWKGRGIVTLTDGQKEPVSCKIQYEKVTYRKMKVKYLVNATCAISVGVFELNGVVLQIKNTNRYSGRFRDENYSNIGTAVITVNGNRQTIIATGDQGRAVVTLRRR